MAQLQAKSGNNQPPKAAPPGPNGLKKVGAAAKDAPKPGEAKKPEPAKDAAKPEAKKPEPGKPAGLIIIHFIYLFNQFSGAKILNK